MGGLRRLAFAQIDIFAKLTIYLERKTCPVCIFHFLIISFTNIKALTSTGPIQIARFKRQRAAESKLLELNEQKERRGRSTRAAALSSPVDTGDDDVQDDDGEEEREVSFIA